jgi:hypothetical protein
MTPPVVITKRDSSESWVIPGDVDCLPALLAQAPLWRSWGYTISTDEPATPITKGDHEMDKPKQIIKRAELHGDVDQSALMQAVTKLATKQYPDARTPEVAFAKLLEATPGLRGLIDAAPKAVEQPARSSFEALAKGALAHCQALGVPLPANSPYAPFLKASETEGRRDDENEAIQPQVDKTVKAIAESLIARGLFTGPDAMATCLRYMRQSPVYAHHFRIPGLFAEGRRNMLASR